MRLSKKRRYCIATVVAELSQAMGISSPDRLMNWKMNIADIKLEACRCQTLNDTGAIRGQFWCRDSESSRLLYFRLIVPLLHFCSCLKKTHGSGQQPRLSMYLVKWPPGKDPNILGTRVKSLHRVLSRSGWASAFHRQAMLNRTTRILKHIASRTRFHGETIKMLWLKRSCYDLKRSQRFHAKTRPLQWLKTKCYDLTLPLVGKYAFAIHGLYAFDQKKLRNSC